MSKNISWVTLVSGILSIVSGLYVLANPALSLASFAFFFSIVFMINGIGEMISYFTGEDKKVWNLVNGILTVLLSFWLFSGTFLEKVAFIPYIFAIWAIFNGITKIVLGLELKKVDKKAGNLAFWLGILGLVAGIILLGNPFMALIYAVYMISFALIFHGISNSVLYFKRA